MPQPTPAGQSARQQLRTPYYGLVNLALANIAYTDESAAHIHQVHTDLPANVAALPPLPGATPNDPPVAGSWRTLWGPCVSRENANLLFVAGYFETGAEAPLFAVVSVRGTDTSAGAIGLFQQVIEDIDGLHTVPFPVGAPVRIAAGTLDGLNRLIALEPGCDGATTASGGSDITRFVGSLVAADPELPVIVTGHSLGGCQTTVLATYLKVQLPAAHIIPASYAGPTAGMTDFADQFDQLFPDATQWWNTLDVVPNAFQDIPAGTGPSLRNIKAFWGSETPPGPPLSFSMGLLLDGVMDAYPKDYVQPSAGRQALPGFVWTPPCEKCKNDWGGQLLIQHLPPMYHCLISRRPAAEVAPYPLPIISPTPDPCTNVTCSVAGA